MIECPRCGFIQPEDRYCASCGLDVQSYKPTPRHWSIKLLRSPMFQAGISLFIILALIWSLFRNQSKDIEAQIVAIENSFEQAIDPDEESENPQIPEPPVIPATPARSAQTVAVQKATEPVPAPETEASPVTPAPAKIPDAMSALFFEVSKDLLAETLKEAQSISVLPTLQIFRLASLDKLKALAGHGRRLPGSMVRLPLKEGVPTRIQYVFPAINNPQLEMGLRLEMSPPVRGASDDARFSTRISGTLMGVQRGAETQPLTLQMDDLVESSLDQPIAILGLIPNNIFIPTQPAEISKTPFAVLGSLAFQQNANEVLLILQFEDLAPGR